MIVSPTFELASYINCMILYDCFLYFLTFIQLRKSTVGPTKVIGHYAKLHGKVSTKQTLILLVMVLFFLIIGLD